MGRKYLWNIKQETEVAPSNVLNVETNPDLEWREEPDPEPAAPQVEEPAQKEKPAAKKAKAK